MNNKDEIIKGNNEQNIQKKENEKKCLPSFLTPLIDNLEHSEHSEKDEDYFNNQSNNNSDEESNDDKTNLNSNAKENDKMMFHPNSFGNSTNDNSNNNYFKFSSNNFLQNNQPQFNSNQNYYFSDNSLLNINQNNLRNLSMNNNNFNLNYLNNNNINSSINNYSYNSFSNANNLSFGNCANIPHNWNSFSGFNPMTSLNFPNNNFMQPLPFNNNNNSNNMNEINNISTNNNKCLSFNQTHSNQKKNFTGYKVIKYKKNKSDKFNLDENSMMNQSNLSIKKLFDMTDQSLYNYIITQKGSRDAQTIIKKVNENEVELLISKLKNYISDITIDKYGNYFSQKLIQICLPSQRIQLLDSMKNRFVEIANNSYGTHPLQSLIEIINMPQEKQMILHYILGNERLLALDSKGTHVLQKFISCTKDEERKELNTNLINLIDKLIIDPFGVCVLIQLIKHTNDKSISQKIANYITKGDPLSFIQHPYANYAVQILISSNDLSYCDVIIDTIVVNYLSLSMQKYSSNVVENCIKFGKEATVKKIYKSIMENEKLESLLNNNYGNFVLEKLISRLSKEEKMAIIKKLEKLGKNKTISNTLKSLLYK